MSDQQALLAHYRALAQRDQPVLPLQQQAQQYLQQHGFPDKKIEDWHYTALNPLLEHAFTPASAMDETLELDRHTLGDLLLGNEESYQVVVYNGAYQSQLSKTRGLPAAVQIDSLQQALAGQDQTLMAHLGKLSGEGEHLFNALNTAYLQDGVYIRVPAGCKLDKPIEILHVSLSFSGALMAQPRHLVVLEAGAEASLVEHYASLGDSLCFNNMISEVFLAEQAKLHHARLQNESRQTRHLASLYIQQQQASQYHATSIAMGGLWSRIEFHNSLDAPGAEAWHAGLYMAGNAQLNNNHLKVLHRAAGCRSREVYKGILKGQGRAVFDGLVKVDIDAQQTHAHLSNANLLLSRDAEIDTKPILEIEADDVQCSHGTTVGQIDPELLFYLRARGIPEHQARQMICLGFAGDIVETLHWPPLRDYVEGLLQQRLQHITRIG